MPPIFDYPTGLKVGVGILFPSGLLFLIAFATPFWLVFDIVEPFIFDDDITGKPHSVAGHVGLWTECIPDCQTISFEDVSTLFHVCRTLQCLCLLVLVAACLNFILVNFSTLVPDPLSKILVISLLFGGLSGIFGLIMFRANYSSPFRNFSWSLYLSGIGSIGSIVACVLIGKFARNADDTPNTGVTLSNVPDQPQQGGLFGPSPVYAAEPSPQFNMQGNYSSSAVYVQNMDPPL